MYSKEAALQPTKAIEKPSRENLRQDPMAGQPMLAIMFALLSTQGGRAKKDSSTVGTKIVSKLTDRLQQLESA